MSHPFTSLVRLEGVAQPQAVFTLADVKRTADS
jgi:hypothetical protein